MSCDYKTPLPVDATVEIVASIPLTVLQGTTPWVISGSLTPSGTQDVNIVSSIVLSTNITNASLAVTGPLTDTELRASPVPVTIPTPVPVTQSTSPWIVDGSGSIQPISGTVTALQGTSPWVISGTVVTSPNVNIHDSAGNNLSSTGTSLDVNITNAAIPVTQSGVWSVGRTWVLSSGTDSVASVQSGLWSTGRTWTLSSGTDSVAAVQSGAWSVAVNNFPATQAVTQSTSPWVVSLASTTITGTVAVTQSTSPWVENVSQFGGSNVVTGTGASGAGIPRVTISNDSSLAANQSVNVNQVGGSAITLGQKTMANSAPVAIASDQTSIPFERVATSAVTRVASNSAASQTLLASNANRKQAIFYNDSTGVQYLKFGTTASTTDFTVRMTSQSYYELPLPVYTGRIDSISGNNNGAIQVTELTV